MKNDKVIPVYPHSYEIAVKKRKWMCTCSLSTPIWLARQRFRRQSEAAIRTILSILLRYYEKSRNASAENESSMFLQTLCSSSLGMGEFRLRASIGQKRLKLRKISIPTAKTLIGNSSLIRPIRV